MGFIVTCEVQSLKAFNYLALLQGLTCAFEILTLLY